MSKLNLGDWKLEVGVVPMLAIVVAVVGLFVCAAWVGRERARQSVECVRVGGVWVNGECMRKP